MILAANQTEIDLGLPIDSLKLVDIIEVGGDPRSDSDDSGDVDSGATNEQPATVTPGYQPRTRLNLPNAPFAIDDQSEADDDPEYNPDSNSTEATDE